MRQCGWSGHGELVARYLDHDLDPVDTFLFEEHVERCDGCARTLRFERNLRDGIRSRLSGTAAPPALRERVRSLIAMY